jgi:hypothetical protein
MAGNAAEKVAELLRASRGSPVVEEFATILCGRWLREARSAGARDAADARLLDGLESLVDWAARKGLLDDRLVDALAYAGV